MLHNKFCGIGPLVPEKKIFNIYGRGDHLGHVTHISRTIFFSPYPRRLHIKFCFDWSSGFREEDV